MVLLSGDVRTLGQRLNDQAARITALGAEADATIEALRRNPLNVAVTDITSDAAMMHWTPVPGTTAYVVGRDGKDNRESGTTAFVDPANVDRRLFVWLRPATTYHLFVLALPSGIGQAVEITTGG